MSEIEIERERDGEREIYVLSHLLACFFPIFYLDCSRGNAFKLNIYSGVKNFFSALVSKIKEERKCHDLVAKMLI